MSELETTISPKPDRNKGPHGVCELDAAPTTQPAVKPRKPRGKPDGLFQRNGWWWVDFYDAEGRRHRKKAAPDYQTAKTIYRETMTRIARGEVLGVREEGIRLRDFVDRIYWPTVQPTLSLWEQKRARTILDTQLFPRFGGTKLAGLRREVIERWLAERLTATPDKPAVAGATANKELMRLKHLLNRAVAWGYLKDTPAKAVKRTREAPGRARYLEPEERDALLAEANPDLRLFILAALQTGARRGELLTLRWREVDMKARTVTFRHTKNGDARPVPMTDTLREALTALPRPLDPDAHVFPEREHPHAITRAFERLARRLEIPNLRFHDLRHDAASTLTMAGVPQRTIMAILGHRDPRMTMRYQHLAPGHLQDAMRALDSRPHEARKLPLADAR
jgi:integrase